LESQQTEDSNLISAPHAVF